MKQIFALFITAIICCSCGNDQRKDQAPSSVNVAHKPDTSVLKVSGLSQQDSIKATASQVLKFLKAENYPELIKYFDNDGVLFSPYGFIDTAKSKKITPPDFLEAIAKNWILTWGTADGTGDPIKLTVKDYLHRFVYNADYLNAEAVGYDQIVKQGNTQVNLKEVYRRKHFIDYHFSGFDQKLKGMDWTSLRLVFEKQDGQYFLIAIVHDQWTI